MAQTEKTERKKIEKTVNALYTAWVNLSNMSNKGMEQVNNMTIAEAWEWLVHYNALINHEE